jgi:hypothetical protein
MAYNESLVSISLEAGVDLSAKQYHFVSMSTDGQIDPTGDGLAAIGVLQNDPSAAGRAATVGISGVTKIVCAGNINPGQPIASDAAGKAVAAATSGDVILGVALAAGNANDIIPMIFQPRNTV